MLGTMNGVDSAAFMLQVVDTLHSWFTPTLLFLLLIGTIAVWRNPSLLSRISSIGFTLTSSTSAISLEFGRMDGGTIDYEGAGKIDRIKGVDNKVQGANFKGLTDKASTASTIRAKNAGNVTNVDGDRNEVNGAEF